MALVFYYKDMLEKVTMQRTQPRPQGLLLFFENRRGEGPGDEVAKNPAIFGFCLLPKEPS